MKKRLTLFSLILVALFAITLQSFAYDYDYPEVYDLHWSNRTAKWSVDGHADKYEVRLYRDDRRVFTRTQTGRSRNFASEMARGDHEYYFEVRPFNYDTGWGNWEQSDSVYIRSVPSGAYIDSVGPGGQITPTVPNYPGMGPGEGTNAVAPQIIYNPLGTWVPANNTWHFMYSNGVYASNSWIQIGDKWYYIDANTNMVTGLMTIGNSTYYFNPDGTMVVGGIIINGINHYFDSNGKMVY